MTLLRRKIAADPSAHADLIKAWRVALPRAAREAAGLDMTLTDARVEEALPDDALADLPDNPLIVALTAGGGCGALILPYEVFSSVVEVQMTGQLSTQAQMRAPTRIDATLNEKMVDLALALLVTEEEAPKAVEALQTVDQLRQTLGDAPLRHVSAMAHVGARQAVVRLLLPVPPLPAPAGKDFPTAFSQQIMTAEATLTAVLCRLTAPLATLVGMQVGTVIALPQASTDEVGFETGCGKVIAQGRLGQNRGMRAVRLGSGAEVVPLRQAG